MQDQIAELAARLNSAATEDEVRSVDLAIYHTRNALEQQHRRTRDGILAALAALMETHEDERARIRKLENDADEKIEALAAAKQEEAA